MKNKVLIIFIIVIFLITGCNKEEKNVTSNSNEVKSNETNGNGFDKSNTGRYTYTDSKDNLLVFELRYEEDEDAYLYYIGYYPAGSTHASEEQHGVWDVTKESFNLNNESTTSLAKYKVKNVKYNKNSISFETTLTEMILNQYKDYVIPDSKYVLKKEQ